MLKYTIKTAEDGTKYLSTSYRGKELLSIPRLNKGTAFTIEERKAFGLVGKLPSRVETLDEQAARSYAQYQSFTQLNNRNSCLNRLLNLNQILFYKLVGDHVAEMLPTIYTPMVGDFVQTYSKRFTNPRGLYISYNDQDDIEEILENRTNKDIKVIVVSDGEGVLGIGDQGVGAMAIPIAKLMVYTLFGGIDPDVTLPILLDAGTNNQNLLSDPFYIGWRHARIEGDQYNQFLDKFIAAVKKKFPNVFLHWEDFGRINAHRNLVTYRDKICSFNDDIQGTGVVALGALLAAAKKTKTPLKKQRIVVFGGGAAGMGVTENIYKGLLEAGIKEKTALTQFWIVDRNGLITENLSEIMPMQQAFARAKADIEDWEVTDKNNISLLEVIKHVKPTVLIGASAQTSSFTKEIIETMAAHVKQPVILPLSNPNERAEATPHELIHWTDGRALIATGSPFPPVEYKGKTHTICQCNNSFAFPGIGLGIMSVSAKIVTDSMLLAASNALGEYVAKNCHNILPTITEAKAASKIVAIAIAKTCLKEGNTLLETNLSAEELVESNMWEPQYLPYRPV